MCLTARERILMIRLMEKLEKHPTYAKTLGIEATGAVNNQNMESDPKGLRSSGGPLCFIERREVNESIHCALVCLVLLLYRQEY